MAGFTHGWQVGHSPGPLITRPNRVRFRYICGNTPLIDEGEAALFGNVKASGRSEDLRSILNAGHTRKFAFVLRAPREGGDGEEVKKFSVWEPKAYAAIGKVPGTVRSRSITIRMRRSPRMPRSNDGGHPRIRLGMTGRSEPNDSPRRRCPSFVKPMSIRKSCPSSTTGRKTTVVNW